MSNLLARYRNRRYARLFVGPSEITPRTYSRSTKYSLMVGMAYAGFLSPPKGKNCSAKGSGGILSTNRWHYRPGTLPSHRAQNSSRHDHREFHISRTRIPPYLSRSCHLHGRAQCRRSNASAGVEVLGIYAKVCAGTSVTYPQNPVKRMRRCPRPGVPLRHR